MNDFEKNLRPFDADKKYVMYSSNMKIAIYNGVPYTFLGNSFDQYFLFTFGPLNETSEKLDANNNTFSTSVSLDELSDIISCDLYVKYKGNIYKVMSTSSEFNDLFIATCPECVDNIQSGIDGFTYSLDLEELVKRVKKSDVEQFLCNPVSVYQKYQNHRRR